MRLATPSGSSRADGAVFGESSVDVGRGPHMLEVCGARVERLLDRVQTSSSPKEAKTSPSAIFLGRRGSVDMALGTLSKAVP